MPVWNVVWKGAYHDSVTLMRLTRDLEAVTGVRRAAVMMGTPPNRALLADAGLLTAEGDAASPTDLLIAVAAEDEEAVRAAEAAAHRALALPTGSAGRPRPAVHPRSLGSALRVRPDATLALISVPGLYAGAEALKALRAGLHVMLFSDNVPLQTEVELKRFARSRGLLCLGPDCGSAIINGVPLGFANAVPRGRIGIAAASGTGLQEVACLIAHAGEGISHAIGVGGRDLSDEVGGQAMEQALVALAEDPGTAVVCVLGKPPGPATARRLEARIHRLGKPWATHWVGSGKGSLEDCARAAVALARGHTPALVPFSLATREVDRLVSEALAGLAREQRFIRGVYSGGTLAWEALATLRAVLTDVAPGVTGGGEGHRVVDLGEDVFTVGRPHPMIDGAVRRDWIVKEAGDPATAVLLLDVVLGYGAHPDPAGDLLPGLQQARSQARARGGRLPVVASVTGTDADPQSRTGQVAKLVAAGVTVMASNAQAARLAARIAVARAKSA